ncbi:MAG: hypothetical protein CL740_03285 [Chloroflexi bacterium]|nr:hypothetical protein [Chloroflexota bacterium]|tara:strand:- start:545 stop:820 length:276 start_codon:yes stop_codon:yes gene_type:complete
MKLYWKEKKKGFDLIVENDEGETFSVGGVRETKRGIEALAKTTGYDPGRAVKGLQSLEEGRTFVEQFEPWREFFPGELLELDSEIVTRDNE